VALWLGKRPGKKEEDKYKLMKVRGGSEKHKNVEKLNGKVQRMF